jgi:hypothetical protein
MTNVRAWTIAGICSTLLLTGCDVITSVSGTVYEAHPQGDAHSEITTTVWR